MCLIFNTLRINQIGQHFAEYNDSNDVHIQLDIFAFLLKLIHLSRHRAPW